MNIIGPPVDLLQMSVNDKYSEREVTGFCHPRQRDNCLFPLYQLPNSSVVPWFQHSFPV